MAKIIQKNKLASLWFKLELKITLFDTKILNMWCPGWPISAKMRE